MKCSCRLSSEGAVLGLPKQLRPRFLSGLSAADMTFVLSLARHRQCPGSSVIVHQGDPADRCFLLTSGHGRHFVISSDGRKTLLHWLIAGQIFGGAALLATPIPYLASTELLSDSCAFVWDRQTIRESVVRWPGLLDNLLSISVTDTSRGWSLHRFR